jgi:acyl-CoA synthetase (AMP-forming)/AMP-acid ligase II
MPQGLGVAMPRGRDRGGKRRYETLTFRQLDDDSTALAAGLAAMGVEPGMRLVLLVRPGIDFISLVFAMFKAGAVTVLIDPGMGRSHLIDCLADVEPDGFVAVPAAHAVRTLLRRRFPKARMNVTVGRRWFWGGRTIDRLRSTSASGFTPFAAAADDHAAIIFTTGSTGPPKGVLYRHGNFAGQVDEIRDFYGIEPGEIDVPGFPLFALFNCAMGVSTIVPEMDFTRPARVDPRNIVEAVEDFSATQAFGSPALWNAVGRFCEDRGVTLPTLRRVLSAGAPVPVHVLRRMKNAIHESGDVHTPYGATESLPVASISASEVLAETAARSAEGAGTCVGRRFGGIAWKVIRASDEPIPTIKQAEELPPGEIGEIIVRGAVVTSEYVTRTEANALHKIRDGERFWHRIGDVGYLDEQDRFWFCGRKAHRVETPRGTMYTIPCEAIINGHERIYRSALVGVGPRERQRPVIVAEPWPERRAKSPADEAALIAELQQLAASHELTRPIEQILLHDSLPVDIRHNAKIFREKLAVWAERKLGRQ